MITCVTIFYIALNCLVYKILKIKPRPTNVAAMVVIGILMIGTIVIFWKFSAPIATNVVVTRHTVQLVPQVGGPIESLNAKPNRPLKKGKDVLFEIQKAPYEMAVRQVSASMESASTKVSQLQHGIEAAQAAVEKAKAGVAAAKAALDVALETQKLNADAISRLSIVQLQAQLAASVAGLDQSRAAELQAEMAKKSAEESVVSLQAQLDRARFNLEKCVVLAPADGFVTNWQVREGTMIAPSPQAAVGTFIDSSSTYFIASLPQNTAKNIKAGQTVEFAMKSRPGEIFSGTVEEVIQATGEGQLSATGNLMSAASIGSKGFYALKLRMDEEEVAASLPLGSAGSAAIYTDSGQSFHAISKVTVRMNAWLYYLIPM